MINTVSCPFCKDTLLKKHNTYYCNKMIVSYHEDVYEEYNDYIAYKEYYDYVAYNKYHNIEAKYIFGDNIYGIRSFSDAKPNEKIHISFFKKSLLYYHKELNLMMAPELFHYKSDQHWNFQPETEESLLSKIEVLKFFQ